MSEEKRALRNLVIATRDALAPEQAQSKTAAIKEHFFALPEYRTAKLVMYYVSFRSEVETREMIQESMAQGKSIVAPVIKNNQIWPAALGKMEALAPGPHGILQPPEEADRVALSGIDLVVVPGTVFDLRGYRLGYGGGYYDRFLRHVRMRAALVGLAFETQIVEEVPTGPHDVPVDKVVTEDRVIDCRPLHP